MTEDWWWLVSYWVMIDKCQQKSTSKGRRWTWMKRTDDEQFFIFLNLPLVKDDKCWMIDNRTEQTVIFLCSPSTREDIWQITFLFITDGDIWLEMTYHIWRLFTSYINTYSIEIRDHLWTLIIIDPSLIFIKDYKYQWWMSNEDTEDRDHIDDE